jgi:hypothetical protein
MKKRMLKAFLEMVVAALTALITSMGVTSCM